MNRVGLETQLQSIRRVIKMLDAMAASIEASLRSYETVERVTGDLLAKPATVRGRRGRPTKKSSGWPDDPAERSAEMRRRQAVARGEATSARKKPRKKKPTVKLAKSNEAWDAMSPQEQKKLISKMGGRTKRANGAMEEHV